MEPYKKASGIKYCQRNLGNFSFHLWFFWADLGNTWFCKKDNNKLVSINLGWNGFGNDGAAAISKALAHNVMLEELDIRSNRIDSQGFVSLCACFKENTTLKKLFVIYFIKNTLVNSSYIKKKFLVEIECISRTDWTNFLRKKVCLLKIKTSLFNLASTIFVWNYKDLGFLWLQLNDS